MHDDDLTAYRFRCLRCHEQCHATRTDRGIGAYEYWGRQERHAEQNQRQLALIDNLEKTLWKK